MVFYGLYLLYGVFAITRRLQRGVSSYPHFISACCIVFLLNILGILLQFSILALATKQIPVTTPLLTITWYLLDLVVIFVLFLISQRMMCRMMGRLPKKH